MTWTQPRNLRDNEVITAAGWNRIMGTSGSIAYLTNQTNFRAGCTVFSARFSQTIAVTGPSSVGYTRITSFLTSSTNINIPNRLYFNRNRGIITLKGGIPFICIWNAKISDGLNAAATGITVRSTFDVVRKRGSGFVNEMLATTYLLKNHASQINITGSFGGISLYNSDRYFVGFNHNSATPMLINGTITLMLYPCLV